MGFVVVDTSFGKQKHHLLVIPLVVHRSFTTPGHLFLSLIIASLVSFRLPQKWYECNAVFPRSSHMRHVGKGTSNKIKCVWLCGPIGYFNSFVANHVRCINKIATGSTILLIYGLNLCKRILNRWSINIWFQFRNIFNISMIVCWIIF